MTSKYRISQEKNEWVVSDRKTGLIHDHFERRDQAEEYLADQLRADEQSQVLGDYNRDALIRELAAEIF